MTEPITAKTYQYSIADIEVSPEEVYKMARMDEGMFLYSDLINSEIKRLQQFNSVKGQTLFLENIEVTPGHIKVDDIEFNVGKQVSHYLRSATSGVLFICTAGPEISSRSQELMAKGDLVEGFLLDTLGSIIVEKAMDKIQAEVTEAFRKENKSCSNRYSPGYCEWSVGEQTKLFSFFPNNTCGIALSDSCLMSPVKSVSGIVGIGENIKFLAYKCDSCNNLNCVYRNIK